MMSKLRVSVLLVITFYLVCCQVTQSTMCTLKTQAQLLHRNRSTLQYYLNVCFYTHEKSTKVARLHVTSIV